MPRLAREAPQPSQDSPLALLASHARITYTRCTHHIHASHARIAYICITCTHHMRAFTHKCMHARVHACTRAYTRTCSMHACMRIEKVLDLDRSPRHAWQSLPPLDSRQSLPVASCREPDEIPPAPHSLRRGWADLSPVVHLKLASTTTWFRFV